jgi:hypothetical protein
VIRWVAAPVGLVLIGFTAMSVIKTFMVPRETHTRLNKMVSVVTLIAVHSGVRDPALHRRQRDRVPSGRFWARRQARASSRFAARAVVGSAPAGPARGKAASTARRPQTEAG